MAQDGFFLQPMIEVGSSGVLAHDNLRLGTYKNEGADKVSVFNGLLGAGYRVNHWEISSGIFFLRSGYFEHTVSGYQFLTDTKTTQYYDHIALPVIAGYQFRMGKLFSMTPGFGYEISYNYSDNKTVNQDGVVAKYKLTGSSFTNQYKSASLWTLMRLEFEYTLNKKIIIVAGPEFHDMISSMLPPGYNIAAYQYSRIFSLNGGIIWNFVKK